MKRRVPTDKQIMQKFSYLLVLSWLIWNSSFSLVKDIVGEKIDSLQLKFQGLKWSFQTEIYRTFWIQYTCMSSLGLKLIHSSAINICILIAASGTIMKIINFSHYLYIKCIHVILQKSFTTLLNQNSFTLNEKRETFADMNWWLAWCKTWNEIKDKIILVVKCK